MERNKSREDEEEVKCVFGRGETPFSSLARDYCLNTPDGLTPSQWASSCLQRAFKRKKQNFVIFDHIGRCDMNRIIFYL